MNSAFIKRFLKSSFITTAGTFFTLAAQFFIITLLARVASEELLGQYFLLLAAALALKIFANLGLDLTLVKFLAESDTAVRKEVVSVILLTRVTVLTLVTLLVFLLGKLALPLLGENLEQYLIFIPFIFAGHSLRELLYYLLQGNQQFKHLALVRVASAVLKLALFLIFRQTLTLTTLFSIELVVVGIGILLQISLIPFRKLGLFSGQFNQATFRRVLKFGFPLYLSSLVNSIGGDSAIFIINFYLNPIGIAFYEIAEKIPEGVDDLLSSFDTVYYPSISTLFAEEKPAEALLIMNKSAALMTGLMSIICVGAFLFGEMMIGFIFSEKYVSVSLGMTLSMVAVLFGMVGNIFGYTLVSADKPHTSTVTNTISVFIFILGALLLVPPFGFIGAIWAGFISNLFDVIIYAIYLQKYHLKPQFWRIFQPLLLGVLFCVGVALLTPVNWLIRVGLMSLYPLLLVTLLKDFRQLKRYLPTIKATIAQRANGILSSRS